MPGSATASSDAARSGAGVLGVVAGRLVLAPVLVVAALVLAALAAGEQVIVIDRFGPVADPDGFPTGWEPLTFPKVPAHTRYRVVQESDNHVLKAESRAAASGVYRPLDVDPRGCRIIAWRWKVESVLRTADARRKEGDDYPARVYVAFRYDPQTATLWERTRYGAYKLIYGRHPPRHVINYIWDNRLPKGTILENAYTDRAKMIVVQSGPAEVGRWVAEERNLYADYRRAFGAQPPRIAGIALMTDTDDTGESAVAYYDDIVLKCVR